MLKPLQWALALPGPRALRASPAPQWMKAEVRRCYVKRSGIGGAAGAGRTCGAGHDEAHFGAGQTGHLTERARHGGAERVLELLACERMARADGAAGAVLGEQAGAFEPGRVAGARDLWIALEHAQRALPHVRRRHRLFLVPDCL